MKKALLMLSVCGALLSARSAFGATLYVNLNNPAPVSPFGSWATAATNIQDAVDLASAGDQVLVTNGVYQSGGRSLDGSTTNRLAITNAITVRSVNGPSVTTIAGYQVPGTTNGAAAIRCAYLAGGAVLSGFTLTNGATLDADSGDDNAGGAVSCDSQSEVITNCAITGNVSQEDGGGVYSGTVNHCWITNNWTLKGGGGGAHGSALNNCLLANNLALYGGGADTCLLSNCTVVGNTALPGHSSGSGSGGGTVNSTAYNTIIYYNQDNGTAPNTGFGGVYWFCCATPLADGYANITNAPLFLNQAANDFHLAGNSPCINSGANADVPPGPDLAGLPRITGGSADIGAYEVQNPASVISVAWLQANNLATDGSADFTDPDGDGMNNWQEWMAGTDPHSTSSFLKLFAATDSDTPGGVVVSWQSVPGRSYTLQRATSQASAQNFSTIVTNIFSQGGTTYYEDFPPPGPTPAFYRVSTNPEQLAAP